MAQSEPTDAERTAQRAQDHAEEAARKLDRARSESDPEAATAADVEENTAAEVRRQPSEESGRESDITGPGAPMP